MRNPFRYFNSSPEVIRLTVMMYIRYPLSLRQVEDLLFERGIDICHETVRFWWNRFGLMFAAEIWKRRIHHRSYSQRRWHLGEVFVRINGAIHYLWRAVVDRDGPSSLIRRRDGEVQGHQDAAEVRFRSRLDSQSFQSRPSPQPLRSLREKPISRSGRVASTCGLSSPASGFYETGSIYSDNVRQGPSILRWLVLRCWSYRQPCDYPWSHGRIERWIPVKIRRAKWRRFEPGSSPSAN